MGRHSLRSKAVHFVSDLTTGLLNPISDKSSKPPVSLLEHAAVKAALVVKRLITFFLFPMPWSSVGDPLRIRCSVFKICVFCSWVLWVSMFCGSVFQFWEFATRVYGEFVYFSLCVVFRCLARDPFQNLQSI